MSGEHTPSRTVTMVNGRSYSVAPFDPSSTRTIDIDMRRLRADGSLGAEIHPFGYVGQTILNALRAKATTQSEVG